MLRSKATQEPGGDSNAMGGAETTLKGKGDLFKVHRIWVLQACRLRACPRRHLGQSPAAGGSVCATAAGSGAPLD